MRATQISRGLAVLCLFTLSACSFEKTGGNGSGPLTLASALVAASQNLAKIAPRLSYAYNVHQGTRRDAQSPFRGGSLAAFWITGGSLVNLYDTASLTSAPNMSAKSWMAADLDPAMLDASGMPQGLFGRFSYLAAVACVLTSGLPADSSGLPTVANYPSRAVSFSGPGATACALPAAASGSSFTAAIQVNATTLTTSFDRSLSISGSGLDNETLLVRLGASGLVNLALFDDQSPAGRTQGTRLLYFYDPNTRVTRVEYLSASFPASATSRFEMYRTYVDEATNRGYLLGGLGSGDFSRQVSYTLVGPSTRSASDSLALSLSYKGQPADSGGGTTSPNAGNACLDPPSGGISSDGTLSCTVSGTDVSGASALDGTVTAHPSLSTLGVSESSAPAFTNSAGVYSTNG